MATIRHQLVIHADREKIFEALTTQQGLSNWWTRTCIARPETGFENEFRFGDQYVNKMKILDLQKNKKVEWQCIKGDDEWLGTHIVFELEERPGRNPSGNMPGIFLNFQQAGWKAETDFFASCNFNWGRYLLSLKHLVENGKGNPFPDTA